jgi:hypothetical protein
LCSIDGVVYVFTIGKREAADDVARVGRIDVLKHLA